MEPTDSYIRSVVGSSLCGTLQIAVRQSLRDVSEPYNSTEMTSTNLKLVKYVFVALVPILLK